MIDGVIITPLKIIDVEEGDVLQVLKSNDFGYEGFGEAYFSMIKPGAIKSWKRHNEMVLNLIVPIGIIKFVLFDDRDESCCQFQEVYLSRDNYCRLTIPPQIWVGFQGMSDNISMLLNIANIKHNTEDVDRLELAKINYNWGLDK